jgi:hypothetical protein
LRMIAHQFEIVEAAMLAQHKGSHRPLAADIISFGREACSETKLGTAALDSLVERVKQDRFRLRLLLTSHPVLAYPPEAMLGSGVCQGFLTGFKDRGRSHRTGDGVRSRDSQ